MRFVEGPLKGEVWYNIAPKNGGCLVRIRSNVSSQFQIPGMSWRLRRSIGADLRRLKSIVEGDECLNWPDTSRPDHEANRPLPAQLRQQLLEDQHDGLSLSRMYDT